MVPYQNDVAMTPSSPVTYYSVLHEIDEELDILLVDYYF